MKVIAILLATLSLALVGISLGKFGDGVVNPSRSVNQNLDFKKIEKAALSLAIFCGILSGMLFLISN